MLAFVRILGVGDTNDLGDMYMRLAAAGHDVRVFIADASAHDMLEGLITRAPELDAALAWAREAGDDAMVVFEGTERGAMQDELRALGMRVVGGSAYGDRLEMDRAFGQATLAELGLKTASIFAFDDAPSAAAFVQKRPARYVLKFDGSGVASTRTYVGRMADGSDVAALLRLGVRGWMGSDLPRPVLMEHVSGVEVGVGAFFDGERFLRPANIDWEHKRFFPGDLGEMTGEMGTLASYRGAERIFDATLAKLAPRLREARHCGYVNLNTIVDARGVWPLELTCRFGYPGFALLGALHEGEWDEVLAAVAPARGKRSDAALVRTHDGFSVGVVLTVPPFPYRDGYDRLSRDAPVILPGDMTDEERRGVHLGEVKKDASGGLVMTGCIGYAMVVTARAEGVEEARRKCYGLADRVVIPNVRYRNDIGERFVREDRATLTSLGWYP